MLRKLSSELLELFKEDVADLLTGIRFVSPPIAETILEEVFAQIKAYSDLSFLCIVDRTCVGLIFAKSIGNFVAGRQTCEVRFVSVSTEYRGKNIAESLIDHLKNQARTHCFHYLYLTVFEENQRAISFYGKVGFQPYILSGQQQTVVFDKGAETEHTDVCMVLSLASKPGFCLS